MKAALVSLNFETLQTNCHMHLEGNGCLPAILKFKERIESDFPDRMFGVIADEEARINNLAIFQKEMEEKYGKPEEITNFAEAIRTGKIK